MAYTVKQVAALSGVSVRALHFYHQMGLLNPAYIAANGYRFYEEPQLLSLQQILFYRELGFELKQIKRILGRADFEIVATLQSHRKVLQKNLDHTRLLLGTIDKTIKHMKGTRKMKNEEMFVGFSLGAGQGRFGEKIRLGGREPHDCKVSAKDTDGAMCIFEFTGHSGGPRHLHDGQDEWVYIIDGEFDFQVGDRKFRAGAGECVFVPRKVAHAWACMQENPGKVINVYQPAGKMEEFYREVGKYNGTPLIHDALGLEGMRRLFDSYGMRLLGPPLGWDEYLARQSPAVQDRWKKEMEKARQARG